MPTILIRNVPEEIHARLTSEAAQNRRSAEKHALFLIEAGMRNRRPLAQWRADLDKVVAQCKREVTMEEILKATEEEH